MVRHNEPNSGGWKQIIVALAVQTLIGGFVFWNSFNENKARVEEKIVTLRRDVDANAATDAYEHRALRELIETRCHGGKN